MQRHSFDRPGTDLFHRFWTDLGIIFQFFLRFCEPNFAKTQNFLNTKREAKSQPRTRQDQTRSNKINQTIAKHKPANTTHRNRARHAEPQNEGAAVSRRMASSIRSRPAGARGVFRLKVGFPFLVFYHLLNICLAFLQIVGPLCCFLYR